VNLRVRYPCTAHLQCPPASSSTTPPLHFTRHCRFYIVPPGEPWRGDDLNSLSNFTAISTKRGSVCERHMHNGATTLEIIHCSPHTVNPWDIATLKLATKTSSVYDVDSTPPVSFQVWEVLLLGSEGRRKSEECMSLRAMCAVGSPSCMHGTMHDWQIQSHRYA
jgi:hypothetical protein